MTEAEFYPTILAAQAVDTASCEFTFEEPDIEGFTKFLVEELGPPSHVSRQQFRS